MFFLYSFKHLSFIFYSAHRAAFLKGATVARRPCCRIPCFAGFRPVALRPTLSSGLPFSSFLFGNEDLLPYFQQNQCQKNIFLDLI
jgi:hypothetical protein